MKKYKKLITASSSPNLLSPKEKSYNIYTNVLTKKMENYSSHKDNSKDMLDLEKIENILNHLKIKINKDEKDFILKVNRSNKNFFRHTDKNHIFLNSRNNDNDSKKNYNKTKDNFQKTFMKVTLPQEPVYFSPLHSLSVLKLNRGILSDLKKSNLKRQKSIYDISINENKKLYDKLFAKMPKIKISRFGPKFNDIPIINKINFENNNTNNKSNNKTREEENENNNETEKIEKIETNNNKNTIIENNSNNSNNISKFNSDKKMRKYISLNEYLSLFCYYKYPDKNFPESREQFSLLLSGSSLFLIGGICCDCSNTEIWLCDLDNVTWNKIKCKSYACVRFGHTSIFDKSKTKIFVYGGRVKYEKHTTQGNNKNIFCELEYYDIKTNKWIYPFSTNKNTIPSRRNHIAELVGNQMIIMGGIDENGKILNNVYYLNLNTIETTITRWQEAAISSLTPGPYLFGHSSSFVVQKEILKDNKLNIYEYPTENKNKVNSKEKSKIKFRGIYIFGGKTNNDGIGGLSDDMYVLVIGEKPCFWLKIDNIKGIKPKARYFHSMNFYEPGNFLIIHGGRNDFQNDSFALDDTFIFDLALLQWHKVELYSNMNGFKVVPRCAHKSVIYSNKLIIFGGMNNTNYIGSSLFIINLNSNYSPVLKTPEEILLDKITRANFVKNDKNVNNKTGGKEQKIEELKEKINQNHKLGFVREINLPWIK